MFEFIDCIRYDIDQVILERRMKLKLLFKQIFNCGNFVAGVLGFLIEMFEMFTLSKCSIP